MNLLNIELEKEYVFTKYTQGFVGNESNKFTTTYTKKGKDLTKSEIELLIGEARKKSTEQQKEINEQLQIDAKLVELDKKIGIEFKSGKKYSCYHVPSKEEWLILGISKDKKEACVAGWPATIAKIEDCIDWKLQGDLTKEELKYREKAFGSNWL